MKKSSFACLISSWVTHFLLFFAMVVFVINSRVYPYADDWAYLSPLSMHSMSEYFNWLMVQHVDHRIPIQKALHSFLGEKVGFDFRVLVFLNVLFALLTSIVLTASAHMYRGSRHFGDIIIPLIVMSPVMGYSLWAFQFQFLSSIFFVSTSFYFFCRYIKSGNVAFHSLALTQLFLCALCGMNGVIFSSVLIILVASFSLVKHRYTLKLNVLSLLLICLVFLENVFIWLLWTPSAASSGITNISSLLECFFKLLPASMVVYTFSNAIWNIGFVLVGLLLAAYGLYRAVRNEGLSYILLIAAAIITATLALVASAAIARSKAAGDWDNTLIMHYGFLTVLLPIFSWIIISKYCQKKITVVFGVVAVIVFTSAYFDNYKWRYEFANSTQDKQRIIANALKENDDVRDIVEKFNRDFTWSDSYDAKQAVVVGLEELRQFNFPIYSLLSSSNNSSNEITGSSRKAIDDYYDSLPMLATRPVACKGSLDVLNKISPAPNMVTTEGTLDASGWLLAGAGVADNIYLVLSNAQGVRKFFRVNVYERPDVSKYFNDKKLLMSGFSASLDLSTMQGLYTLEFAIRKNNIFTACENIRSTISIGKQ